MTNSWDKGNILADLYRGYTQWVPPLLEVQEDGKVRVTLPRLTHIPLNGGVVSMKINKPVESILTLWLESFDRWKGWRETLSKLCVGLYGKVYRMWIRYMGFRADTQVSVTIDNKEFIDVSCDHTDDQVWDMPNYPEELQDFHGKLDDGL